MKKLTAFFLLLCILLAMLPLGASATETTEAAQEQTASQAANQCGENLTWKFDNGTLIISGSGAMDNFSEGNAPWQEYKDRITSLAISGDVTSIGEYAFADYDSLKEVNFGTAMHSIEKRAFYDCDGLTTFTLPDTFRKFGEECFMRCDFLREIRCLGGMPSFKASCLWDCPVTVFYPTTNPWPAEYVTPLFQSYQGKIQIFMGDGIEEASVQPEETEETQPAETAHQETAAATVLATEATEPVTVSATETTEPVTEPATEAMAAETIEQTVPEATEETIPQAIPEEEEKGLGLNGVLVGMLLITGTLSLILIGALIFHRRSY